VSGGAKRRHSLLGFCALSKIYFAISNSHYTNWFFESPPLAGFQKTNFGVSSAEGAGNTKIGFIMRIAALLSGQPHTFMNK